MKGFLAVARREIDEKRSVLVAALVASLVSFMVPIVRGIHGIAAGEARQWTAMILAAPFGLGLAIAFGVSILSKEIANRRIGFYFARPIPAVSVWAGKLLGAFALTLIVVAIIIVPAWLSSKGAIVPSELPRFAPLLFAGLLLFLLIFLHGASIVVRSRSRLLALDALILLVAAGVVFAISRRLIFLFAGDAVRIGWAGVAGVSIAGLIIGGAAAVVSGRTDIRAAHREFSTFLWSMVALGLVAFAAFDGWVRAAKPTDMSSIYWITALGRSHQVALKGYTRYSTATFLLDTDSGSYERAALLWEAPVSSGDGRVLAWVERTGFRGGSELVTLMPGRNGSRARIPLSGESSLLGLSEVGDRAAVSSDGNFSVIEIPEGRSVGSARVTTGYVPLGAVFRDRDHLRIFSLRGDRLSDEIEVSDFDLSAKTLRTTAKVGGFGSVVSLVADPSGERLLISQFCAPETMLLDASSGRILLRLGEGERLFRGVASFLSDGRVAFLSCDRMSVSLRIYSTDAILEKTIALPGGGYAQVALGGQVAPNLLVVEMPLEVSKVLLVDLASGQVSSFAKGLSPVATNPFPQRFQSGSLGAGLSGRLFFDQKQSLVLLDPVTGQKRVLLGRSVNP